MFSKKIVFISGIVFLPSFYAASLDLTRNDPARLLPRAEPIHTLEARQNPGEISPPLDNNTSTPTTTTTTTTSSKSTIEKSVRDLFNLLTELGDKLGIVTDMATNSSEVLVHADLMLQSLQRGETLRGEIVKSLPNPGPSVQTYISQATQNEGTLV